MSEITVVAIRYAIKTGNLVRLKEWVESGQKFKGTRYDLTSGDNDALLKAAEHGQFKVVKWLVEDCGQTILPTSQEYNERGYWPNEPMAEDMNAVIVAVKNQHYIIAKWLLLHHSNNLSAKVIREMLKRAAEHGDLRIFKSFFSYASKRINVVEHSIRLQVIYSTFDIFKWFVKESGHAFDLTAKNGFFAATAIRSALGRQGEISLVAKWLVEESGQVLDCRDCESWVEVNKTPFNTWNMATQDYLLSVKQIQDAVGLENWREVREKLREARNVPVPNKMRL